MTGDTAKISPQVSFALPITPGHDLPRTSAALRAQGDGTPAVLCEGLSFTYPGAAASAIENISLRVESGERLGVLGPNGGGKSTLLKLILGLLPVQQGRLEVLGMAPARARAAGLVGYVAQRSEAVLAMPLSVREVVSLAATWRLPPWTGPGPGLRARVERAIELVGAGEFAHRPIGKLSGGQFQRAMIARALAASARMLVLDEPTVGIDASGQRLFGELLDRVHRETGLTLLVVSHDLRAIAAGSDRVACLARRLHSHTSPQGLTPQVLAEVFSHDLAGVVGPLGGQGVHIHAHRAGECADCGTPADAGPAPQPSIPASVPAPAPPGAARADD